MRYAWLALKLLLVPLGMLLIVTQVSGDRRLAPDRIDVAMLFAAIAANQVALALFAARMRQVLRVFSVPLSLAQSFRIHLQSMFYFFVVPMNVGLELARFAKIRTMTGGTASNAMIAYALFADRVIGAAAALILALALLPFMSFRGVPQWGWESPSLWLAALGVLLLLGLLAIPRLRAHLSEVLALCRSGRAGLAASLAVATATHALFALGVHLAAVGTGVPITFTQSLFAVSASMLFILIPVSFAGVTPIEAAGLGVLVGMGIPLDQAAMFVFLSYLAKLLAALQGGAWEILEGGEQLSRTLFPERRPKP